MQIGAYANAFPPQDESATANDGLDEIRKDLDAPAYLGFAKQWQQAGASLVGGCCGIGPEHIAELSQFLKNKYHVCCQNRIIVSYSAGL